MSFSSIPTLLSALMVSELSHLQKCLRKQTLRSRKMLSFSKENSHRFCRKSPFSSLKELNTKLQYTLLHTSGLSLLTGCSLYIYICISAHLYLYFYLYLLICNPKVDKVYQDSHRSLFTGLAYKMDLCPSWLSIPGSLSGPLSLFTLKRVTLME